MLRSRIWYSVCIIIIYSNGLKLERRCPQAPHGLLWMVLFLMSTNGSIHIQEEDVSWCIILALIVLTFFNGNSFVGQAHGNIKHAHSEYAKKQMLNIIVGEVYCNRNRKRDLARRSTPRDALLFGAGGDILSERTLLSKSSSTGSQLERYKNPRQLTVSRLISKERMSQTKGKRKLMLFEFDYDVIAHSIGFDGDYILLHEVDKKTITRAYTPIHPQFILCDKKSTTVVYDTNVPQENRLFLLIRIYKNGAMSAILNKLEVGHTIRITGPFRREKLLPSPRLLLDKITPNENWLRKWLIKLLNNTTADERDLARHELEETQMIHYQYWRHIVLICGGTGVTPMLNMIRHHLEHDHEDIRINLIWHNRTLNDVCLEEQLKYYKKCNPMRFWIDLKFDVPYLDMDLKVNEERLQWARLHAENWYQMDMIEMVKHFLDNGMPMIMDSDTKCDTPQIWPEKRKDNKMYSSVDISTDSEDIKEQKETETRRVSSDGYVYDTTHEMLDHMINELSSEEQGPLIEMQNTIKLKSTDYQRQTLTDVIILSGPRPFIEKLCKRLYDKKHDLHTKIICLD
eukprot:704104_1